MRIHLVNSFLRMQPVVEERAKSHLASFAYVNEFEKLMTCWKQIGDCNLIVDSGAFTAWSLGKQIKLDDYIAFINSFSSTYSSIFNDLIFMNLDVIGDQNASDQNLNIIASSVSQNITIIPILTYNATTRDVESYVERFDYYAIAGGALGLGKKQLTAWYDKCFRVSTDYWKRTGVYRKTHLLGLTKEWTLMRYPCYSSDSSTWLRSVRYGETDHLKTKSFGVGKRGKIPRSAESDIGYSANVHSLRLGVQKFMQMQKTATDLWKARGIDWNE